MNLKTLLDTLLSLGSNISIKEGKEIHKSKLVSNLNSKKINNVYHIYSKVSEEDESRVYSCHIKYDLMNEKVIGTTCTCNTYEEFSRYKKKYVCKHIIATIFSFYIIAKNKIKKHSNEIKGVKKIKETDPNASVIMCSAMGQQAMVIESIQSGAKDFIVKPFQADRVLEAVQKVVG